MEGLTSVSNNNSSGNLTLTGASNLVALDMTNVSGGNTTIQYKDSVLSGATDTQELTLNGNASNADTAISSITIGESGVPGTGLETLNIKTETAASKLTAVVTGASTVNVTGDQNLQVTAALAGATTINASTMTGNLDIVTDSATVAKDVVVTGGTGDDRADFTAGWNTGDSFDGGEGTDTLGLNYTTADTVVVATSGTATNVEVLDVTNQANAANSTGDDKIDMDNFSSVSRVVYNAGIANGFTTTVDDATTGITVEVDADTATTGTLAVELKTDGTTDEVSVVIDEIGGIETMNAITANDAETLNIAVDDDSTDNTGALTLTSVNASDASAIKLTGDADVTITNVVENNTTATSSVLKTVDASEVDGKVTINGIDTGSNAATITLGAKDDVLAFDTVAGVATANSGADTITLGTGKDTVRYTAVAQSDSDMDTITDFVSGTDKLDLSYNSANGATAWAGGAFTTSAQFTGTFATFGQAQGSLAGGGVTNAVFQADQNILWLDSDGNGTLDNNDLRIKLDGVTTVTAADLGFGTGNTITLDGTATAPIVNINTKTGADAFSTNENDTINGTVTQLNLAGGNAVRGLTGTDTLNVTGAGVVNTAGINSVETITLGATTNGITSGAKFGAATGSISTLTGAAGKVQTLTLSNSESLADVTVTNIEALNITGTTDVRTDEDSFIFSSITGAAGIGQELTLTGNAPTDVFDFSAVALTGVETLDLATVATVTLDAADLNDVTNITGDANIVLNDADDLSGITIANGQDSLQWGTFAVTLDTENVTNDFTVLTGNGTSSVTTSGDTAFSFGTKLTGVNAINAASVTAAGGVRTITLGTGSNGLTLTTGDIDDGNALTVNSASDITINALAANDDAENLILAGSGNLSVTNFGGDDLDSTATGTVAVTIGAASTAVNVQANSVATSTTIDAAAMADDEVLTVSGNGNATVNNVTESDVTVASSGNVTVNVTDGAANQVITGGAGNDILNVTSTNAADAATVNGGAGNDTITGGTGIQTIIGGSGQDALTGGAQADAFVIQVATGTAEIFTANDVDDIKDFSLAAGDDIDLDFSNINGTVTDLMLGDSTNAIAGDVVIQQTANGGGVVLNAGTSMVAITDTTGINSYADLNLGTGLTFNGGGTSSAGDAMLLTYFDANSAQAVVGLIVDASADTEIETGSQFIELVTVDSSAADYLTLIGSGAAFDLIA